MRKSIIAILVALVLSTTTIAASLHHGTFQAKDGSGKASGTAIEFGSYESCRATFVMADGRIISLPRNSGTDSVYLSGIDGIRCKGRGSVTNSDKTKIYGDATLVVAPGPVTGLATLTITDNQNNVVAIATLPTTTFRVT